MKKKDNRKSGELETIRKNIDSIDEKIQLLINDRARLAKEIGLTINKKGSGSLAAQILHVTCFETNFMVPSYDQSIKKLMTNRAAISYAKQIVVNKVFFLENFGAK